jgi:transglutaminase-like putative cysteine protease
MMRETRHDSPMQLSSQLRLIPSGKDGIVATLRIMRDMVRQFKKTLPIRTLALQLTNGMAQKAWSQEIAALHAFVRDRIRYVRDITDVETVQTPVVTLQMGAGDCDDKVTLLAALLESIGHPTRFVAVGFRPEDYEHVYLETRLGAGWIPLETTEPVEPGWSPPRVACKIVMFN